MSEKDHMGGEAHGGWEDVYRGRKTHKGWKTYSAVVGGQCTKHTDDLIISAWNSPSSLGEKYCPG